MPVLTIPYLQTTTQTVKALVTGRVEVSGSVNMASNTIIHKRLLCEIIRDHKVSITNGP